MLKIYHMTSDSLKDWVQNSAKPGDLALSKTREGDPLYYVYLKPDPNPYWTSGELFEKLSDLQTKEATVNKRCETCKHWHYGGINISFCTHDSQKCIIVPKFTCCDKHEPKETKTTPFDGVKFYLIDSKTGELGLKYVCESCGKIMDKPDQWWLDAQIEKAGYHFRCAKCAKSEGNL